MPIDTSLNISIWKRIAKI